MNNELHFTIPVVPQGWQRARRNGNRYFVNAKEEAYRSMVRMYATRAMNASGWQIPDRNAPIMATLTFTFPIPQSYSKKKREYLAGRFAGMVQKPDSDNCSKVILDSLSGILYEDDRQVSFMTVEKRYEDENIRPSVRVEMRLI